MPSPEPVAVLEYGSDSVAVISMVGRFPGAADVRGFWRNLCEGVESVDHFTPEELIAAGREPSLVRHPRFVGAEAVLDGYDLFDAGFFGYAPREAQVLDPQHRVCLEAAWHAFDTAGYDPARIGAPVGVYLSASLSSYLIRNLLPNQALLESMGGFPVLTHNDKDFLASTVSYKLGLTGPSMAIGTACSSSLVAMHVAVQALLSGECDLALAGGVSLQVPARQGYIYRDDGIYSPDGHCRPFGAGAAGTVGGSGVGVVLLKRWRDAARDGDHVHAVILGSAVNNDGAAKAGYTAPGVDGQAAVIVEAQAVAGVDPGDIGYVEAHGTGTRLGDAIELEALSRAFRRSTDRRQYCTVGAVKGNIGHLDAAAGVAGLIKTVLAVEHATIPATVHCEPPNEELRLADSPFRVSPVTGPWPAQEGPRLAGVSAFGIGGSNAHIVIGQAPQPVRRPSGPGPHPILLSARDESTLEIAACELAAYLRASTPDLASVAATLASRRHHGHRFAVVASDCGHAAELLEDPVSWIRSAAHDAPADINHWVTGGDFAREAGAGRIPVPGYPLKRERYWIDPPSVAGVSSLDDLVAGLDVSPGRAADPAAGELDRLCGALAHSYLRAAGVDTSPGTKFTRAELVSRLGVLPSFRRFAEYLINVLVDDGVLNATADEVAFAAAEPVDAAHLARDIVRRHPSRRGLVELLTHCAAHYAEALNAPGKALSVLYPGGRGDLLAETLGTGDPAGDDIDRMIRALVQLAEKLAIERAKPLRVLEVGAGGGRLTWPLAEALKDRVEYTATDIGPLFVDYLRGEAQRRNLPLGLGLLDISRDPRAQGYPAGRYDLVVCLDVVHATPNIRATLGHLMGLLAPGGLLGVIETTAQHRWLSMIWGLSEGWWEFADGLRRNTPLLDHDGWAAAVRGLEGQWAVLPEAGEAALIVARPAARAFDYALPASLPPREPRIADWCYVPGWRRVAAPTGARSPGRCLVLSAGPIGDSVAEGLSSRGGEVTTVRPPADGTFAESIDFDALLRAHPATIAALWTVDDSLGAQQDQAAGLHTLLALARAIGRSGDGGPIRLVVATQGAQEVLGGDLTRPGQATTHAATKVIPREYPSVACVSVDLAGAGAAEQVIAEILAEQVEPIVAYRHGRRWLPTIEPAPLPEPSGKIAGLRPAGVYLVCGGLGGLGMGLAEHLAALPATVVLTRRRAFAPRQRWEDLAAEDPNGPEGQLAQRLLALEAAGGTVVVEQADLADADRMRDVVERTVARFGPITGVIHAAGIPDEAGMIQRRSRLDTETAMSAKLAGTLALAEALRDQRPEFVLLCSSIGTVLHKLKFGEVGYLAGHEFLQAYAAHRDAADPGTVVTVAWTDWLEGGMWARAQRRLAERYVVSGSSSLRPDSDLLQGLTTAEGVEIFRRVLACRPGPVVIVSTQSMPRLLAAHEMYTTTAHAALLDQLSAAGGGARRSDLSTTYVAPETATERAIARIWSELLGVDAVGVDDDFFEAGGDSLIALRLLARIREATGVDHPVSDFFGESTIRAVAAVVDAARPDSTGTGGHEEVLI